MMNHYNDPPAGQSIEDRFFAELAKHDADLPGAIRSFIERVSSFGAYPVFRISLSFEAEHPADGRPIKLGTIDHHGRLSTEEIAADLPPKYPANYAQDLSAEIGGKPAGRSGTIFTTDAIELPSICTLLPERASAWADAMESFIERTLRYLKAKAAGQSVEPFELGDLD